MVPSLFFVSAGIDSETAAPYNLFEMSKMTNEEKILDLLAIMNNDIAVLKADMCALKTDVSGIRIDIENRIDPYLQVLTERQKGILETLAPKNRVEALEEVDFMKRVIKTLAKEVDDLKKAN